MPSTSTTKKPTPEGAAQQTPGSLQLVRAAAPSAPKTPFSVGDLIIYTLLPFLGSEARLRLGLANTTLFTGVQYFQTNSSIVPRSMLDIVTINTLAAAIARVENFSSLARLAEYESLPPPSSQELDLSKLSYEDKKQITDDILIQLISERPYLTSINLSDCSKLTNKSVEFIAEKCPNLKTLDLTWTKVSNVSALAACTQLETLDLSDTTVSDVSALAACTQLKTLDLSHTKVIDVSKLAACTQLKTLSLDCTQVSNVSALAACTQLETLDLSDTTVSDVSALAACTQLKTLDLSGTPVSDVSALAACTQLKTLYLNETEVIDVSKLAACTQLKTLSLSCTKVSDVSKLAACTQLKILDLGHTEVSEESIQNLYALHPNKDLAICHGRMPVKRKETAKPAGFFANMEKERSAVGWAR